MTNIQEILLRRSRRRFTWALIAFAVVAVAGLAVIILAGEGVLDPNPWMHFGLAASATAGVAGMVMTLMQALVEDNTTSAAFRAEAEQQMNIRSERRASRV